MPEITQPEALAAWESWWSSPMALLWHKADWPALQRLALLTDAMFAGTLASKSVSELRHLESLFGLSPAGRKGLRWILPGEDEVPEMAEVRPLRSRDRPDPRLIGLHKEQGDG
jgi:hypothetical protein